MNVLDRSIYCSGLSCSSLLVWRSCRLLWCYFLDIRGGNGTRKTRRQSWGNRNASEKIVFVRWERTQKAYRNKQCRPTYNVSLRCIHESLLPWKSSKYHVCLCVCVCACVWVPRRVSVCIRVRTCSLFYPACNAYALYCDVFCGLWVHHIFRHYLINGTIFRKKLLDIKCVFWFSLQLLSMTFLILGRI